MSALELFNASRVDRADLFNRKRLLAEIGAAGFDAVVALSMENVTYTSGAYMDHLLLPMYAVTVADGTQLVVVNEADAYYVRDSAWVTDVRPFRFGPRSRAEALELLVAAIAELGIEQGRIGIERQAISADQLQALEEALPGAKLEDAADVFARTRLVKTDAEIELYAAAAYATAKAIATAFALARPGDTEKSLQASMQSNVLQLGADSLGHAHVHAGVHSTVVHTHSLEQPIVAGEVIHADFGAGFGGYQTDLARNAVVGAPTKRQAEIYRKLHAIEEMLYESIRPGVTASSLFVLGERAHTDAGLEYPWGTLGHGSGLSTHDGFELSVGSDLELEPGMILNIEPSHIEAGDARYHIEDSVLVTEKGARLLSSFGREPELFSIT